MTVVSWKVEMAAQLRGLTTAKTSAYERYQVSYLHI